MRHSSSKEAKQLIKSNFIGKENYVAAKLILDLIHYGPKRVKARKLSEKQKKCYKNLLRNKIIDEKENKIIFEHYDSLEDFGMQLLMTILVAEGLINVKYK